MTLIGWLALLEPVILIAGIIGGYIALKSAMSREASAVSKRVIDELHIENEVLQGRVQRLETDNTRLSSLMELVVITLKKATGIELEIDNDIITQRTPGPGNVTQVSRLRPKPKGGP